MENKILTHDEHAEMVRHAIREAQFGMPLEKCDDLIHQTLYGVESWEPGVLVEIDGSILRVESRDGPNFTFTRAIPQPGEVPIRLQRPIELEP